MNALKLNSLTTSASETLFRLLVYEPDSTQDTKGRAARVTRRASPLLSSEARKVGQVPEETRCYLLPR